MKRIASILFVIMVIPAFVQGQANIRDSAINVFLVSATYAPQIPEGELSDRFGIFHSVGPGIGFKHKSNFLATLEFNFLFGDDVREDPLADIKADNGFLINARGEYEAFINYYMRGIMPMIRVGKLFPVVGPNPNSGIIFMVGAGLMQHKIRYEHRTNAVAQLEEKYVKGYDRLTNGLAISETLGYLNLANNKLINFSIAFEATQGFTQNRRDWNFDTMEKDAKERLDLTFGVRLTWSFPIYRDAPEDYYYY